MPRGKTSAPKNAARPGSTMVAVSLKYPIAAMDIYIPANIPCSISFSNALLIFSLLIRKIYSVRKLGPVACCICNFPFTNTGINLYKNTWGYKYDEANLYHFMLLYLWYSTSGTLSMSFFQRTIDKRGVNMLGKRIKELRLEKRITQSELSNYLGLTPKMVSFYELEQRFPPQDMIIKLADYFNVSADYLLGRSDIRNPDKLLKEYSSLYLENFEEFEKHIRDLRK